MNLTRHAAVRCQQRGISRETIEALLSHGARRFDHRGGCVVYFDHAARAKVARDPEWARKSVKTAAYLVVAADSDVIITAAIRKGGRVQEHA